LSNEIEEFAAILDWDIRRWEENWHLPNSAAIKKMNDGLELTGHIPIRGVSVIPHPDCEPLYLTFRKDGLLASSIHMVMMADEEIDSDDMWLSTKTQYSSAETHAALIKLLKFVKGKYISNLEVHDDGGFWDEEIMFRLEERFNKMREALDRVPQTLNLISKKELKNRTPEEIADFIEDILKKKFGK
jgi:hypothetical protein